MSHLRFSMHVLAAVLVVMVAASSRAALSSDGWPQTRRDATLTGRTPEQSLPSGRLRWFTLTGAELSGEPVVDGCSIVVTDSDGRIHAFNARSGAPLWSHAESWAVQPTGITSALAIDGTTLFVGLPADPLLERALTALAVIQVGLASYAIDYNGYPPGPDLAAALTPTYMRSMPANPVTGAPMVESQTPSPGDYRYESVAASGRYYIGAWGTDGGLLDLSPACQGYAGLAPSWPVSAERGGSPTALELATGASRWRSVSEGLASSLVPTIVPGGVDWASQETHTSSLGFWGWWWGGGWGWLDETRNAGAVRRSTVDGSPIWDDRAWGGARGATAHDMAGNGFVSMAASQAARVAMGTVRSLATACESYSIDYNAYPPSGDLEASLVPTYIPCMPPSLLHDGTMLGGSAASGADYEYVTPDGLSYTITAWDEDGGVFTVFDTGAFTVVAEDLPPQVASLAPDGSRRWRTRVGLLSQDVTPVALASDGSVIVGTTGGDLIALDATTGVERWRTDVGEPLSLAPALLPDGGAVVVTGNGSVVAHGPDGTELWRRWLGATVTAAPSTTADGVTYVADLDGTLTALSWADGATAWTAYLGGPYRAGLSTTPVQSGGWLYVGRTDGALLAVVPRETAGRPPNPVPLLATGVKSTTTAGWTWTTIPVPTDPGAHWHLRRWRGSLGTLPDELLVSHPSSVAEFLDVDAGGPLIFYSLLAADCAENESFGP